MAQWDDPVRPRIMISAISKAVPNRRSCHVKSRFSDFGTMKTFQLEMMSAFSERSLKCDNPIFFLAPSSDSMKIVHKTIVT
jgi:hypothetical protein